MTTQAIARRGAADEATPERLLDNRVVSLLIAP